MGTITGFYGYVLFHIFIPPETNNNLNFELTKKINDYCTPLTSVLSGKADLKELNGRIFDEQEISTSDENPVPPTTIEITRLRERNDFTKFLLNTPTDCQIHAQNIGVTYTERPEYCNYNCMSCVCTSDIGIEDKVR